MLCLCHNQEKGHCFEEYISDADQSTNKSDSDSENEELIDIRSDDHVAAIRAFSDINTDDTGW